MKIKFIYYSVWIIVRIITKLFFCIRIKGSNYLPKSGGFILATNHISHFDPPLIGSWSRRQLYYVAKQELFKGWLFGRVLPRVNALPIKRGAFDRNAIESSLEVLNKGCGLIIFPEGTRSKSHSFLDPKPGVGMLAMRAKVMIVPAYLHGSNRLKDCFTGREQMSFSYGKPILPEEYLSFSNDKEGYNKIARMVMDRIGALKSSVTS